MQCLYQIPSNFANVTSNVWFIPFHFVEPGDPAPFTDEIRGVWQEPLGMFLSVDCHLSEI